MVHIIFVGQIATYPNFSNKNVCVCVWKSDNPIFPTTKIGQRHGVTRTENFLPILSYRWIAGSFLLGESWTGRRLQREIFSHWKKHGVFFRIKILPPFQGYFHNFHGDFHGIFHLNHQFSWDFPLKSSIFHGIFHDINHPYDHGQRYSMNRFHQIFSMISIPSTIINHC